MADYRGAGFYGLNPPLWVSGAAQQPAGQWVTSPADKEIYQRIAATNSSTTDPADDIANYKSVNYQRITSLSDASVQGAAGTGSANFARGIPSYTVGPLAVGARTSVLSVTGAGDIDFFSFYKGAAGTSRIEIIVDGRTVFDQTLATSGTTTVITNIGITLWYFNGTNDTPNPLPTANSVRFKRSLQVFITAVTTASASSAAVAYRLRGEA